MLYKILLAFCLLIPSSVLGDIRVDKQYQPYDPIIVTCELPDIDSNNVIYEWTINLHESKYTKLDNNQCLHIWAKPGSYSVGCTAVIQYKKVVTILVRDENFPTNISKATMKDIEVVDKIKVKKYSTIFQVLGDTTPPTPVPPNPDVDPYPPNPNPDVNPPTPSDDPIQAEGFNVLVVEETADRIRLPRDQVIALQSTKISEYVKSVNGHFRQTDDDSPLIFEDERWSNVIERPRSVLPWIVISNDKTWYEGPLPKSLNASLDLIKKYSPR